jgi:hypothetical protein
VKAVILALLFVLLLGGCAGGQPRSLTTTANQAEDTERLTSMMGFGRAGPKSGRHHFL